jgi:hypothetical protein
MEETKKKSPFVTALVDLGSAWASHGLDAGRLSLENSAKALTKTAKALENLARELEKKHQSDATPGTPAPEA